MEDRVWDVFLVVLGVVLAKVTDETVERLKKNTPRKPVNHKMFFYHKGHRLGGAPPLTILAQEVRNENTSSVVHRVVRRVQDVAHRP